MGGKPMTDACARETYSRFLAGDDSAFNELADAYVDELTAFIVRIVGCLETAQDLAIDTFAALLANKNPFYGKSTFQTFLFAIGKHLAFKYLRAYKKQAFLSLDDFAAETAVLPPDDGLIKDEEKRLVHAALRGLKADHRCVLYLLFFENMSYDDVGVVMKKSRGQIRGLVYRSKKALKLKLESEGYGHA